MMQFSHCGKLLQAPGGARVVCPYCKKLLQAPDYPAALPADEGKLPLGLIQRLIDYTLTGCTILAGCAYVAVRLNEGPALLSLLCLLLAAAGGVYFFARLIAAASRKGGRHGR